MCGDKPCPFSKKPDIAVINPLTDSDVREPRVKYTGRPDELIAFTVTSEGMFSSVNEVYNTPVGRVMNAYHYIKFRKDYQDTAILLNKEQRK